MYIKINLGEVKNNEEKLISLWKQGLTLCSKYSRQRYGQVVEIVGQKLTNLKRYEFAGDIYYDVNRFDDALECYLAGKSKRIFAY